jgi:hypothetical protein
MTSLLQFVAVAEGQEVFLEDGRQTVLVRVFGLADEDGMRWEE